MVTETLEAQVIRLANYIMFEIPGEPSQSEGAINTAIRLLKHYKERERLCVEYCPECRVTGCPSG